MPTLALAGGLPVSEVLELASRCDTEPANVTVMRRSQTLERQAALLGRHHPTPRRISHTLIDQGGADPVLAHLEPEGTLHRGNSMAKLEP
ncbi:MAG: hypothetical protein OJF50_006724 [Nitrospira sp.]|jgi:hypothetical protein|nr:hypothetical protein [Nitrospira sp.]